MRGKFTEYRIIILSSKQQTECRLGALWRKVALQGLFSTSAIVSRLKGHVLKCLETMRKQKIQIPQRRILEAQKTTPNPEIPKKGARSHELLQKARANFCLFPLTRVRNPTEIVQKKLVQMTFYFGWTLLGWTFLLRDLGPPTWDSQMASGWSCWIGAHSAEVSDVSTAFRKIRKDDIRFGANFACLLSDLASRSAVPLWLVMLGTSKNFQKPEEIKKLPNPDLLFLGVLIFLGLF